MTSRPNSSLPHPPLLHARSSPVPGQSFPVLRPPLPPTPTRNGRSRSTNNVNSGNGTPAKSDTMTYENFNDFIIQKIHDPLYTDQLARLNRATTALSQDVSTLNSYAKKVSALDSQQKSLLGNIREAKETLERDAHTRLNTAAPEIAEQNRTMENIEKRVEKARARLVEQSDMLGEIDYKIAENRRMMSLPPPSSRNIISAPPLHSRDTSRQPSFERSASFSSLSGTEESGWRCIIL